MVGACARATARHGCDARGTERVRARGVAEPLFRRRSARERSSERSAAGVLEWPPPQRRVARCGGRPVGRCNQAARMLMRSGGDITALRRREFSRLDATGSVYLDYAGAALYPSSLVKRDAQRLLRRVFGNPHSENGPSLASTESLEEARSLTLNFFDASSADYDVVFTANASGAMRALAEAFPFCDRSRLVLTADNHNSVNGLRVSAERRRAAVHYVSLEADLRGSDPQPWLVRAAQPSLFAFPAQSNFSGVRHSLQWVKDAQARGYHVLLDAAAYVPSSPLSLTEVPADFVAISFYKMFGYPTGVGALLAR